ncbi:hypothetical protein [Streptomyces californicus]|uniref:hypothetical protein n=1 Tax=Streptomyces californicus TaxID=67351 RepID=UPI00296F30FE|nr:hypothetical protein [Streptomyces californicus]MDW4912528.1 hypothetical protein [Streptomyces californicus]
MAPLNFGFSDPSRHGSSGGSTFRGRAPKDARAASDTAARFEAAERSRETGRQEQTSGRRGLREWMRG